MCRSRTQGASYIENDVPHEEREMLLSSSPDIYFMEDHYRDYEIVLARLTALSKKDVTPFLQRRWRNLAPKRMVAAFDRE